MSVVDDILNGSEMSAARLITSIENGEAEAYRDLAVLFSRSGNAHIIGVTGPAGAGKSTLAGRLAVEMARKGRQVGIIATDPSSISGKGAFLGDRVRMKAAEEQNIFIRSMAHRAYPGGVAKATAAAAYIMEGLGKDCIIMESIGAGQSDKDLFFLCDTVVTVFTPEYGDDIQLFKAGLMEIGDVIVLNKSDKPGSDDALREISIAVDRSARSNGWHVPVIAAQAVSGTGIPALVDAVESHRLFSHGKDTLPRRKAEHLEAFLTALLKEELWQKISARITGHDVFREISGNVLSHRMDPYSAVHIILERLEREWISR